MVAETRSQRSSTRQPLCPQHPTQLAPTSTSTSGYQSSSSLASLSSTQQQATAAPQSPPNSMQHQATHIPPPLPSPSNIQQPLSYFGSLMSTQQGPAPSYSAQQRIPQQQQHPPATTQYVGQKGDGGGMPETVPFLKDFSLVAEAARRAQLACLTRDMADVGM